MTGVAVEHRLLALIRRAAGDARSDAELLARLDAWLKKNRKRYHKGLLPGADDKALASLEKALGRAVPEGLAALLRWHNGQEEDMIGAFVESFNLMSADEIAAAYQERKGEKGWDAAFVPILDDYQGDHVVLDARKPELPVLLITGYSHLAPQVGSEFTLLRKPFDLAELSRVAARMIAQTGHALGDNVVRLRDARPPHKPG